MAQGWESREPSPALAILLKRWLGCLRGSQGGTMAETEREGTLLREESNSRPGAVLGPDQTLTITCWSGTIELGSYGFADNTRACLPLPLGSSTVSPPPHAQPRFLYLASTKCKSGCLNNPTQEIHPGIQSHSPFLPSQLSPASPHCQLKSPSPLPRKPPIPFRNETSFMQPSSLVPFSQLS